MFWPITTHTRLASQFRGSTQEISVSHLKRFLNDESGATAIEYGLIAALISVFAIAAMKTVGTNLKSTFNKVSSNMS
jgi:pilus assembly protein Flp/PilA